MRPRRTVDVDSNSPGLRPEDQDVRQVGGYYSPLLTAEAARAQGREFGWHWLEWGHSTAEQPAPPAVFDVASSPTNRDPHWPAYCAATRENRDAWMEGFRAGLAARKRK